MKSSKDFASLLAPDCIRTIAKKLDLSHWATSSAIHWGKFGYTAFQGTIKTAGTYGMLVTTQQLAKLTPVIQVA